MTATTYKRPNEGFTLLEMLIAITILAVGLLGVAGLQASSIRRNVFAMKNTEATALIEDKIEEYRNTPYADITEGTVTETGLGSGGTFTRISIIQDSAPINDTKEITVQVTWSDPSDHLVSFQTIVSD